MIATFQGEYRWLSNFAPIGIAYDGAIYRSVEHAYMSAKSDDFVWKKFCQDEIRASVVKRASKTVTLVENWDIRKTSVMMDLLDQKFHSEPFRTLLIQTGSEEIQEGNYHGDAFWGIDLKTGTGENMLGKMIMQIRADLQCNK